MGPMSVLGPAGSLGDLICATGKLARQLHRLAKRVRTAEEDIHQFASMLSAFSFASDRACACILQHYTSETELQTLSIVTEKAFLRDAEQSAKYIIDNVKTRMKSMESNSVMDLSLISKFKWAQRKSEVRDLTFKMTALESTLTLLMITVVYEVQIKQGAAPEALAITMRQIKNFMNEAKVIVSKLDGLAIAHSGSAQASQRFNTLLNNVRDIAEDQLVVADRDRDASGLFKRGSWVPINPESTKPREDTRSIRPRRSAPPQERSPGRTHSRERRPRRRRLSQETGTGSLQPPIPPNDGGSINVAPLNLGKGKERQSDREAPEASSSRGVQNALDNISSENGQSIQPLATQLPQRAAMPYFSAPSASDNSEEINGYVRTGKHSESSSQIFKARLYPDFGMNAISRAFAERLRLRVNALVDEEFAIMLPSAGSTQAGVNHSVGDVMLEWQTSTHILHLSCTVFEQEIAPGIPLALGKPYVQQLEEARRAVRGQSPRAGAAS